MLILPIFLLKIPINNFKNTDSDVLYEHSLNLENTSVQNHHNITFLTTSELLEEPQIKETNKFNIILS